MGRKPLPEKVFPLSSFDHQFIIIVVVNNELPLKVNNIVHQIIHSINIPKAIVLDKRVNVSILKSIISKTTIYYIEHFELVCIRNPIIHGLAL